MPIPEHIHRFWRALDDLLGSVEPTWWGAVVTDARFPAIWDANYARVDVASAELRAAEIEADLLPALVAVGSDLMHVVTFHPEESAGLLAELSARGHRLTWDLVMDLTDEPTRATVAVDLSELRIGEERWTAVQDSLALFGVESEPAAGQLRRLEEDVLIPGGKRWFAVLDPDGSVLSLAALIVLEGVGYLDNVATFPEARGRGYASALIARLCLEARDSGASRVCLLADPNALPVVRMYERLGFQGMGTLGSTRGPVTKSQSVAGAS